MMVMDKGLLKQNLLGGFIILLVLGVGVGGYRLVAGPSWKLPECRPAISVAAMGEHEAEATWNAKVKAAYGERFADSGMKVMSTTVCINGQCTLSARPCAQIR